MGYYSANETLPKYMGREIKSIQQEIQIYLEQNKANID